MRTRLRELRALLSLTDNEFYEYLSELSDMCPCMNNVVCHCVLAQQLHK